jgi:phytanoyl-CoA hydroxylase
MGVFISLSAALHELDPTFRRITLQNQRMKAVARDLAYHSYPLGLSSTSISLPSC